MNNGSNPAKGYYSILQYVPDLERAEGANIGVVLFCPEKGFLKAQTALGNDRVRRFFGREADTELDLDRINIFKTAFEERIELEAKRIYTLEDFRHFVDTRANHILLTAPKPMKVFDPHEELQALFERLVGGRRKRTSQQSVSSTEEIQRRFYEELQRRGIADRVAQGVRFESRLLDKTIEFPFAFRNGQPNVIEPVTFEATKVRTIERACQLAVEGGELSEQPEPVKLNVLGEFSTQSAGAIQHIRTLLDKYGVALYTNNEVDALLDVIQKTAH